MAALLCQHDLNGGDGLLQETELVALLAILLPSWSDTRIASVMDTMDLNKDGVIQIGEFVQWVFSDEEKQRAVFNATTELKRQ